MSKGRLLCSVEMWVDQAMHGGSEPARSVLVASDCQSIRVAISHRHSPQARPLVPSTLPDRTGITGPWTWGLQDGESETQTHLRRLVQTVRSSGEWRCPPLERSYDRPDGSIMCIEVCEHINRPAIFVLAHQAAAGSVIAWAGWWLIVEGKPYGTDVSPKSKCKKIMRDSELTTSRNSRNLTSSFLM